MPIWFEQKRYGYGAGLPVAPEGWAVLGAYTVGLFGLGLTLLPDDQVLFLVGTVALTAGLIAVAARTTRGGFRWRWGDEP